LLRLLTTGYGTKRTCPDVGYLAAFGDKADISSDLRTIAIYEYTP
jgi:hypothetical protein